MSATKLTISVFCHKDWDLNPAYRIYVNNDLLTERTWVWPAYEIFIKENIEVTLPPGNHKIIVETCKPNSDNIVFRDLTVNGILVPATVHADHQECSFDVKRSQ